MSHVGKCPKENNQNSFDDNVDKAELDDENNIDSEDENNKLTFHYFLKDHSLHYSHYVTLLDDMQGWVSNFIGGGIPRSDCKDGEYYYSTMLTFFKPWRTGKDLKLEDQSWDDAFETFVFDTRQLEIMKYFNVQYECLMLGC